VKTELARFGQKEQPTRDVAKSAGFFGGMSENPTIEAKKRSDLRGVKNGLAHLSLAPTRSGSI
jgi:hypothetical protein